MKIDSLYFNFNSKDELISKISAYLEEYSRWSYEREDWENEGFPKWTFSGSASGDYLTSHVKDCCLYGVDYEDVDNEERSTDNAWIGDLSFSDEDDRIDQCDKFAREIASTIEL